MAFHHRGLAEASKGKERSLVRRPGAPAAEHLEQIRFGTIHKEEHLCVPSGSLVVWDRHALNQETPLPRGLRSQRLLFLGVIAALGSLPWRRPPLAWEGPSSSKPFLEDSGVEKKRFYPRPGDPQPSRGPLGPSFLIPTRLLPGFPPSVWFRTTCSHREQMVLAAG